MNMSTDFDLESLVHVEQSFYETGYQDGFDHGRIHGLIEGRALGLEQGFAMWEELGFYEGFALTWRAILVKQSREEDRASQHIRILLDTIAQFPRVNPSASEGAGADLDISKLFRQIRSRYKILCSSLGVRPRLLSSSEASSALLNGAGASADMDVDNDEDEEREPSSSTTSRVTPSRSSIPVWKIDSSGVKKPVTNEDLNF